MEEKLETVKINLSNIFLIKSCCSHCGGKPIFYCRWRALNHPKDPDIFIKSFAWVEKHIIRMCSDDYLYADPVDFNSTSCFSYSPTYKAYSPIIHRVRGVLEGPGLKECIRCECGKTYWHFNNNKNRLEIINRKSRENLPNNLLFNI
jgi:hypothetical protein